MDSEAPLKPDDVCFDCLKIGLVKYLRLFKINLNGDTLLKCESSSCMYPYNDEFTSDDEESESDHMTDDVLQQLNCELTAVNTKNGDNELLPQLDCEWIAGNTTNGENISNELADFDITFLDELTKDEHESLCQSGIKVHMNKFADQIDVQDNKNEHFTLPNVNSVPFNLEDNSEQKYIKPSVIKTAPHDSRTSCSNYTDVGTTKDCKEQIIIQSVETRHPASSNMFIDITSNDIPKANINNENVLPKTIPNTNLSNSEIKPISQIKKVAKKLTKKSKKSVIQTDSIENNWKEDPQKNIDYSFDRISELLKSVK